MKKFFLLVVTASVLFLCNIQAQDTLITKNKLIEDSRHLLETLESTHPDPYINGGGKIAFHRRFHNILASIPEKGLTAREYYKLILPFVASIGDGHTSAYLGKRSKPGTGIPFRFDVVEDILFIKSVFEEKYKYLIGGILTGVNNISYPELVKKQAEIRGYENDYGNLIHLASTLSRENRLKILLDNQNLIEVSVDIKTTEGKNVKENFKIDNQELGKAIEAESKLDIKLKNIVDMEYDLIDEGNTVYLQLKSMARYRENFEMMESYGSSMYDNTLKKLYKELHNEPLPENKSKIIAKIPSATEVFREMVIKMKELGTKNLVIDLRKNGGGNSMMSKILVYFLYGFDNFDFWASSYSIRKCSPLYFERYKNKSIEKLNEDREVKLVPGDFDFGMEEEYNDYKLNGLTDTVEFKKDLDKNFEKSPSFYAEYISKKYEAYYRPENIIVLTSAFTYSSGYSVAADFHTFGAKLVGTPSAQAGNCFIDLLGDRLKNTGIRLNISQKASYRFPEDPEKGKILMPDYIMTYDKLKEYNFDPYAYLFYAIESINK